MGRTFNPNEHQPSSTNNDGNYLEIAGEYLLVISKLTRQKRNDNKKPFRAARFKVISGPQRKRHFTNKLFFNDESLWKIGQLCAAMQYNSSFDLDDDGEVRTALMYRPFKAKITTNKADGKTYADLKAILLETQSADDVAMNKWIAEYEAAGNVDPDKLADEVEPAAGGSSGGGSSDGGWDGQGAEPRGGSREDDDNIPF